MRRPAVLALLLVPLLVGAAIGAPVLRSSHAGDPTDATDVSALVLEESGRDDFATPSVDASTAISIERVAAEARLRRSALAVAFERADDDRARREVLFEAATGVEIASSALRSDQHELRRAYADGAIGTETLLRRHAVQAARARQLRLTLDRIAEYADRLSGFSMTTRIEALRATLTGYDGAATARVRAATTGAADPSRFWVAASRNGTVVSTIDDGVYHREAFRSDQWVPESVRVVDLATVEALAFERYPIAINSSQTVSRGIGSVDADIYRIEIGYEQGSILAFVDGDTEAVFYEVHRQPLARIVPGPAVVEADHGLRLAANRTRAGGPLRLATANATTGEPVAAEVLVDGTAVETGDDGVAWTLMPGETTSVVAVTERGNVSLTVRPR